MYRLYSFVNNNVVKGGELLQKYYGVMYGGNTPLLVIGYTSLMEDEILEYNAITHLKIKVTDSDNLYHRFWESMEVFNYSHPEEEAELIKDNLELDEVIPAIKFHHLLE